jgi:hypothetical protein
MTSVVTQDEIAVQEALRQRNPRELLPDASVNSAEEFTFGK